MLAGGAKDYSIQVREVGLKQYLGVGGRKASLPRFGKTKTSLLRGVGRNVAGPKEQKWSKEKRGDG